MTGEMKDGFIQSPIFTIGRALNAILKFISLKTTFAEDVDNYVDRYLNAETCEMRIMREAMEEM